MGSILTNGVFLPAEGERNCYEGLAANWTALDGLIGGYNVHISSTTIHVTAEDKAKWNGKADASALTAHTGDTTIHVTAEDKAKWNGKADASALTAHSGDTTIHVTAEDKNKWDAVTSKADDSDVVHKSGNENINGNKIFSSINGVEPSSLGMPDLSNGIDISSYITISRPGVEDVHTSTYTPTVNGFISVCLSRNGVCGVGIEQGDMRTYAREVPRPDLTTRYAFAYLPVVQNVQVNIISCYANSIVSAKFFPCQGNV